MQRYQSSLHHVPFVLAAVALTAMTMALAVVLPAKVDFPKVDVPVVRPAFAVSKPTAAPTEVGIVPTRIEVFGVRPQKTAFEPERPAAATKRDRAG